MDVSPEDLPFTPKKFHRLKEAIVELGDNFDDLRTRTAILEAFELTEYARENVFIMSYQERTLSLPSPQNWAYGRVKAVVGQGSLYAAIRGYSFAESMPVM